MTIVPWLTSRAPWFAARVLAPGLLATTCLLGAPSLAQARNLGPAAAEEAGSSSRAEPAPPTEEEEVTEGEGSEGRGVGEGDEAADSPSSPPAPDVSEGEADEAGASDGGERDASAKESGRALSGEVATETVGGEAETVGKRKKKKKDLSHYQTGSFAVSGGWGFYGIVPYDDGVFCGQFSGDPDSDTRRKSFCVHPRGVPFLDFTLGYGAHPRLDIVLTMRLNLAKRAWKCKDDTDPDTCAGLFVDKLGFGLFPGIRGWISKPQDMFKLGAALDFMWMHENFAGYRNRPVCTGTQNQDVICPTGSEAAKSDAEKKVKNDDIGVRLGLVLQLDVHHNVGIFLMPTARMGFLRWFEFGIDVQLGVQARFP